MEIVGANSESDRLKLVILGTAQNWGENPKENDCYDPRSLESVKKGIYPKIEDAFKEMEGFKNVLEKHGVKVLRPKMIEDLNQVFARDISFVVGNKFVIPHIIEDRQKELEGILSIIEEMDASCILRMPEGAHAEGGDVLLWHNYLFIGCSNEEDFHQYKVARTNQSGVDFLATSFPAKSIKTFELKKSDSDPRENTLHLDCCFQPIGKNKAILYPDGFKNEEDLVWIRDFFGRDNIFEVNKEEAYHLFPNIFSIDEQTIVSNEKFERLNERLEKWNFQVEKIPYNNIAKMGGLLRCSTQPLIRMMHKQSTSNVVMVRPAGFRMNEQTAVNNYYQKNNEGLSPEEIEQNAIKEFDAFVERLRKEGVNVHVVQDKEEPSTPDALFPNNWMSFHEDGRVALYPMFAENRRQERRLDIFSDLKNEGFEVSELIDFSGSEADSKFMEGTGSLVLDRENRIAYAAISQRTHPEIVDQVCDQMGFRAVKFRALQTVAGERAAIYHTNVMMCIGSNVAMVCLDCVDDAAEREDLKKNIEESSKELIILSEAQINQFAGNMLELKSNDGRDLIVMSSQAFESLTPEQVASIEEFASIVHSPLYLIEKLGGGSARCMIAENFLPK